MRSKKWLAIVIGLILFSEAAQAAIQTLRAEFPVLGLTKYRVATYYDPENFTGFYTQGVEYISGFGKPFAIHFHRTSYYLGEAMRDFDIGKHYICGMYLTKKMQEMTLDPPSPPPSESDGEEVEFYDIMSPIPELNEDGMI